MNWVNIALRIVEGYESDERMHVASENSDL